MKKLLILLFCTSAYAADTTIDTTTNSTSTNTTTSTTNSTVSYKDQPVQRANAPAISINNNDVCVSAISGGVQGTVIGVSMGTTVTDTNCERIKLSRELRAGGMKVASIAIMCQDPRVFQAMIDSNTPCPFKGLIGEQAKEMWNKYPELRPDFEVYKAKKQILIDAGYIDKNGNMIDKEKVNEEKPICGPNRNWNLDQCRNN